MPSLIFRKGLDLKHVVADMLAENYHSHIVAAIKENDFTYQSGRLTLHLAREFGFCYGVDRAVDYAYQTRQRFPDQRVFLTGEIIHNPHVNDKLRAMGVQFLSDAPGGAASPTAIDGLTPSDVVILPAFGVTVAMLQQLERRGCTLVDTTCGSVLNVWKNVRRYTEGGYTSVIHGKVWHEETQATASQAVGYGGRYLVVFDDAETEIVCDYIRRGGDRNDFLTKFANAVSPGFDPDRDLARIGLANQTTMLMSESLAIGDKLKQAMIDRWGAQSIDQHYEAFDTICSATQERQDAVLALLEEPLSAMIVIGGFNSSNTISLAALCDERVPTYHIEDASGIDPETGTVHFRRAGIKHVEDTATNWLPAEGPVRVGLTAGASTPNNKIGETVARILATRGLVLQTA